MARKRKDESEHIGFQGLVNKATHFYQAKGYTHEEAMDIARKIAGRVNADYVGHYRHGKKRRY